MNMRKPVLFAGTAVLLLVIGCTSSAVQQAQKNKEFFLRGVEAINNRDWDALDDLVAPNYVRHCQATPDVQVSSLEDFKRYLKQDAVTFPDSRITVQQAVAEGNLIAFYCTYVGTQKGPMGPFPPSNKQMTLEFAGIHRVEKGKLAESWLTWDNLAALTQLGHFPSSPSQPAQSIE